MFRHPFERWTRMTTKAEGAVAVERSSLHAHQCNAARRPTLALPVCFYALVFACGSVQAQDGESAGSATDAEKDRRVVEALVTAINADDVEAMASLVTEDVEWMSVAGDAISV